MSKSVGVLHRSGSESSFLLIRPLSSESTSSIPPTERTNSSNGWVLYLLPALAVTDLGLNLLVGTVAAFRDDWKLISWGCIRAGIVFWVGWAGKRGIRGGGGWLAGTTMITILLVFWHLNVLFLTRPSDGPPNHRSDRHLAIDIPLERDELTFITVIGEKHQNHGSVQELSGLRILVPRISLSILSVLMASVEELVHTRLARMYGPGNAFVIRRPRQIPSPFPHSQQSIPADDSLAGQASLLHPDRSSNYLRSHRDLKQHQTSNDESDPFYQPSFDRGSSSDYSSGTATTTGTVDQLEHDDEPSDDSSDEFSDSEIVDIPPRLSMCVVLGGGSGRGGLERDVDSLERCLSRSFSRRRLRSSTIGSNPFDREELAIGYGTFGE